MSKQSTQHTKGNMRFLFLGHERPWKTFEFDKAMDGNVFVYRCLPSNLVAWGTTREEAVERLRRTVELSMFKTNDPLGWYEKAQASMSDTDRQTQDEAVTRSWSDPSVTMRELHMQTCVVTVLEDQPMRVSRPTVPGRSSRLATI